MLARRSGLRRRLRTIVRMPDAHDPAPSDRFTFGLWTVGNRGADPFGLPVRPAMTPVQLVQGLAQHAQVGRHAQMGLRAAERHAKGRQHLVEEQQRTVRIAQPTAGLQEARGRHDAALVVVDRLHQQRRDAVTMQRKGPFQGLKVVEG